MMNFDKSIKEIRSWQRHKGFVFDIVKGYDVIECQVCGFKHIIPIPTVEELDQVYNSDYYSAEKPFYFERAKEDLDWWNLVYAERYTTFEEQLNSDRRRILDVGSGPGYFLSNGMQRGWETLGIEPSKQAVEHSRSLGLEIVEGFLNHQTAGKLGKFDVIHMNNVLEHIPHPVEMLEIAYNLLSPDGLVCVIVPNDYNPFQYVLRSSCGFAPWWVAPPHHVNYFDFASISSLISKCGFEIIFREATFPIDMFLLMGDNYVGNDEIGRVCHRKRKLFEKNLQDAGLSGIKQALYRAFAESGLGREVVVVGQRQ